MMINFKCEKCGHPYNIGEKYAGQKILCGQCGRVNLAPPVRPAAEKYVDILLLTEISRFI